MPLPVCMQLCAIGFAYVCVRVWLCECVCVFVSVRASVRPCVRACVCVSVLEAMRKMLYCVYVINSVYVINRVHCALGCVYILLTLLFFYCALRVQVSYKCFLILIYITLLYIKTLHY